MKIMKWRLDFAEIENEKLFNILEIERVKVENEFFKKKLTFRSKLRRKRNEKTLKQKMKLTSLQRLKMNMKQNCSWIV